jgi:hypothetical protein
MEVLGDPTEPGPVSVRVVKRQRENKNLEREDFILSRNLTVRVGVTRVLKLRGVCFFKIRRL